jgi:uncharacterized protein (UPF0332 family)
MTPRDVYDEAEQRLRGAKSEAEFRAAASRGYYAAFLHIREHRKVDFKSASTGADHQGLIEFLKRHSDAAIQRIGFSFLPRLRAIRNHADYDLQRQFTKVLAEEAIERATEIIFELLP